MNVTGPYSAEIIRYLRHHNLTAMNPKAALIDMDGTLYDSMRNHAAAWHRMVTELGIDASPEEFYLYEGRTGASTINIIFNRAYGHDATREETERLYRLKTEYFNSLPTVQPMPGAAEMLRHFMDAGIKRVLVTGSGQATLINRLATDFPGAFAPDMMVTSRDVTHGKPAPEPYLKAMEKAAVTPAESIVVENAPLGVEAGQRSGAFTVAVTTGPIPRQAMEEAGASIVFGSMKEFAESLPALLHSMRHIRLD